MNDKFQEGMKIRREVLGDAHVDRSTENCSHFMQPIQDLVTEYCWGAVWSRPGLARRDRSIANLAMLTALNRTAELKLHVRAAVTNGVSRDEIREVLLQTAIYCGVPAGIESFKAAEEVLAEMDS